MKIQNLAIIFSIIVVTIALTMSLVIRNKIASMRMESMYNQALMGATFDAMKAFEVNTEENKYSGIPESLKRDAKAAINIFMTSLALNLKTSGASEDWVRSYLPAVAITMYDGYYIYTPEFKTTAEGTEDESTKLEHKLQPYIYYGKTYEISSTKKVVLNYTLDNFVVAYYYDKDYDYETYVGYVLDTSLVRITGSYSNGFNVPDDELSGITVEVKDEETNTYISITDAEAKKYYISGYTFTNWLKSLNIGSFLNDLYVFDQERITTIRDQIQVSLNRAIGNYNQTNQTQTVYEFKMPILKETDWERITSSTSIVAFMQGMSIKEKYYNGYALATSYSDPYFTREEEICYVDTDNIFHKIDCIHAEPFSMHGKYMTIKNTRIYTKADLSKFESTVTPREDYETYRYKYVPCYYCMVDGNYTKKAIDKTLLYNSIAREKNIIVKRANLVFKNSAKTESEF